MRNDSVKIKQTLMNEHDGIDRLKNLLEKTGQKMCLTTKRYTK